MSDDRARGPAAESDTHSVPPDDRLAVMPYAEYLKTPEWAERRETTLARLGRHCMACGTTKKLHVHHLTYDRRGHEDDDDLTVLCDEHHALFHGKGKVHEELAEARRRIAVMEAVMRAASPAAAAEPECWEVIVRTGAHAPIIFGMPGREVYIHPDEARLIAAALARHAGLSEQSTEGLLEETRLNFHPGRRPTTKRPPDETPEWFGRWAEIVGPDLAAHVTPVSLEDGQLVIMSDSTAWATQVRLLIGSLLRRCNEEPGTVVQRVVVRAQPRRRRPEAWRAKPRRRPPASPRPEAR